jgi:hypothetical protein
MFLYYPIFLIAFTAIFLFCPFPILYWRARTWFLNACVSILVLLSHWNFNCCSGDCFGLDYTPLNFATFFLETCFAPHHIVWE